MPAYPARRPDLTVVGSLAGVGLLGLLDYATGYELGFFVFYFGPIAVAAWRGGPRLGYAVALLSAVVWLVADRAAGHIYSHPGLAVWDGAIRLFAFLTLAYTVARNHALLTQTRQQVKTLRGLLPICAACKKVRTDEGYWQEIEGYLLAHTDAQFTHGLCQECAEQFRREAGLGPTSPEPGADRAR